ncbi:hypothetical protein SLEP1_g25117 [Rubroshorea leprosula]|uniref:RING-type domain-containing protein n=1 Tax=Rubroshorea leprosula TaxID=152421 RepID=A0AAV5JHP8_9ROSI|nr:hypothetical protein SLEP1_g25117 [Rubroshorea leprosula]
MDSELINTVSSSPSPPPLAAAHCRDISRKKRRSAKLKQCKLDARREQWLSQCAVKNKVSKEDVDGKSKQMCGGGNRSMENLEVRRREEEDGGRSIQHESDPESPSNSPTSILLGAKDCGTNFTNSSSSSSSGGCCSGSITEEDEGGDDDTLDNWEAIADALAADEKQETEQNGNPCLGSTAGPEPISQSGGMKNGLGSGVENSKQESTRAAPRAIGNTRAWRPDDAFRPQSLPNLSKQHSFPATDRHFGQGGVHWASPSSCPICFEDLDLTDSSFLPCLCGFRLCLFCHKRILEEDGRCPACRKPYEQDPVEAEPSLLGGSLTFRLARSCSMRARS